MTDIGESPSAQPERRFGWWDMFVRPEDDPRTDDAFVGEHDTLLGYLRDLRLTLEMKCAGLDADALAHRSVPPSDLSLLGLVRHMARIEQYWFRRVMAGQDVAPHFRTEDAADGDFENAVPDPDMVADAWRTWRAEVEFAERFVAEASSLDVTSIGGDEPIELRVVLVHMIAEYARHSGHADFLRERIDGRVGQ